MTLGDKLLGRTAYLATLRANRSKPGPLDHPKPAGLEPRFEGYINTRTVDPRFTRVPTAGSVARTGPPGV